QVDRYNLVRPKQMEQLLTPPPAGIGAPRGYGTSLGPPLDYPLLDEKTLALPAGMADPPPVAVYPVENAPAILRAQPANGPPGRRGGGCGPRRPRRPRHAGRHGRRPTGGAARRPPRRAAQGAGPRGRRARRARPDPPPRPPLEHRAGERGVHGAAGREAPG